jgi:hypothetical protein
MTIVPQPDCQVHLRRKLTQATSLGVPDYESGRREFDSLRARHKFINSRKNFGIAKAAMRNKKVCMVSAWRRTNPLQFSACYPMLQQIRPFCFSRDSNAQAVML